MGELRLVYLGSLGVSDFAATLAVEMLLPNFPTQDSLCLRASSAQESFKYLWLSPERNGSELAVSEAEDEAWPVQGHSMSLVELGNIDCRTWSEVGKWVGHTGTK